jgi:hypothetical protein
MKRLTENWRPPATAAAFLAKILDTVWKWADSAGSWNFVLAVLGWTAFVLPPQLK